MKEGKWALIRNMKDVIRDRNQNDSNKQQFDTLLIFSWNCQGFPWRKGPKLSWIHEIGIILLVETWEHEESKVHDRHICPLGNME